MDVSEAEKLTLPAGAVAALAVGSIHMACGLRFGLTLILFYLTSSRLTKVGSKAKAALEEQYQEGGRRTAAQARAPAPPAQHALRAHTGAQPLC